jgi:hypothetical protein
MSDAPPKSALEIALERLRKQDEETGAHERALTDGQKQAIAEARSIAEARLAERELLHKSRIAGVFDPAERDTLDKEYRRERERISDERDRKIARIREGRNE